MQSRVDLFELTDRKGLFSRIVCFGPGTSQRTWESPSPGRPFGIFSAYRGALAASGGTSVSIRGVQHGGRDRVQCIALSWQVRMEADVDVKVNVDSEEMGKEGTLCGFEFVSCFFGIR